MLFGRKEREMEALLTSRMLALKEMEHEHCAIYTGYAISAPVPTQACHICCAISRRIFMLIVEKS
jgi:hypothetical protein